MDCRKLVMLLSQCRTRLRIITRLPQLVSVLAVGITASVPILHSASGTAHVLHVMAGSFGSLLELRLAADI